MTSRYTKDSVLGKLRKWFVNIFSEETKPTGQHLFELALSVLALDGCPFISILSVSSPKFSRLCGLAI